MHKFGIAREIRAIVEQLQHMKNMSPDDIDAHLEDIRARIDAMGFNLEGVVRTGLIRLGRIPADMMKIVDQELPVVTFVTVHNCFQEIQEALRLRSDLISWPDRTFLNIMQCDPFISSRELARVEQIISDAYVKEALAETEWEESRDADAPPQFRFKL